MPKWWIPNDLELIDEVPKTSVGKFSKKTLREQFAARETPLTGRRPLAGAELALADPDRADGGRALDHADRQLGAAEPVVEALLRRRRPRST